jgi:hypothetical protein
MGGTLGGACGGFAYPQCTNKLPTHAAVFFNLTNQFNSVSRNEFFIVIETSFPELLPLTKLY